MGSSFIGSAIHDLIMEAERLKPDFSSKSKQIDSDTFICKVPKHIGSLYVLRRVKKAREDSSSGRERKEYAALVSLIDGLISNEIRAIGRAHQQSEDLMVRSNGCLVRVRQEVSSGLATSKAA